MSASKFHWTKAVWIDIALVALLGLPICAVTMTALRFGLGLAWLNPPIASGLSVLLLGALAGILVYFKHYINRED